MKHDDIDLKHLRRAIKDAWMQRLEDIDVSHTVPGVMFLAQDSLNLERDEIIRILCFVTGKPEREVRRYVEDNFAFDS